jgi:hypothetical protein
MSRTNRRFRKHAWIAQTGLVCLGAGGFLISGCSTATVTETRGPAKATQQVAAKGQAGTRTGTAKKPAPVVAKKLPPGRARISDSDAEARVQMAARASQKKSSAEARSDGSPPSSTTAHVSETPPVAGRPAIASTRASAASPESNRSMTAVAASSQSDSPKRSTAARKGTRSLDAGNGVAGGNIKQTAAEEQSVPAAARRSTTASNVGNPVITPGQTARREQAEDNPASAHERRRADRLMQRAYAMFESGYREESLRLASVALELENSKQAVYQPGEERPSDFIALIRASDAGNRLRAIETHSRRPANAEPVVSQTAAASAKDGDNFPAVAAMRPRSAGDQHALVSDGPKFPANDVTDSRSTANPGQVEVPVAPSLRSAKVNIVTVDDNDSIVEAAGKSGTARSVVTADRLDDADEKALPPKTLAPKSSSPGLVPDAADANDIENDLESVVEVATPARTSQLTVASLIGLATGIAGMIGLGWWRRQERRHYAAGR